MSQGKLKIIHYLNQFFGQIGGEEKANIAPQIIEGPVGPGGAINNGLAGLAEISKTMICGDSYFSENLAVTRAEVKQMLTAEQPDLVIAGPAFNAGRYGIACGNVAEIATELGITVISGIYPENPGYDLFKQYAYFVKTGDSAASMRQAIPDMIKLVKRYYEQGGKLGSPEEAGYLPRGVRKNLFVEKRGSLRAVEMLIKKIKGEQFETEYPMPVFDRVEPRPPVKDITKATVALVTSGGIVPKGNPDRIESSSASKYGKYSIAGLDDLTAAEYETAHGGYDPVYANEDPDRVLPLDILRELEKNGKIGKMHDHYYSTVGNGTAVAAARAYAREIADELINDGVQAVILTST